MRNMKYNIIFGIALICVSLFTACDNFEFAGTQTPIKNGYGRISIILSEEGAEWSARSVFPSTAFSKYTYTFSKNGADGVEIAPNNGFFTLEVGSYTVAVQAYIGDENNYTLAASGVSEQFNVGSGNNNPIKVPLIAVTGEGKGKFNYKITYPAGADAEITLQKWTDMNNIVLSPNNTPNGYGLTQTLELDTGSYLLTVLVSKNGLYAGLVEAIHIYPGITTEYAKSFADEDLLGVKINTPIIIEMVQIPGGSFEMGDSHTVTLSSFYMGKYEVTQEQWIAVMGSNPSYFQDSPALGEVQNRRPVERVSWYDTLVFCNKLSVLEGLNPAYCINGSTDPAVWGDVPNYNNSTWNAVEIVAGSNGYRLPTVEQWEYVAKGGNGSPENYTYSGSNSIDDVAWYVGNSDNKTHEVGKKAPNGLGLYDMIGNVLEWCWDSYDFFLNYYYCLGGGFSSIGFGWGHSHPYDRYTNVGFRLVRPLD